MSFYTVTYTPSVPVFGRSVTLSVSGHDRLADIVKIQSDAFENQNQWYTSTTFRNGEAIFENIPLRRATAAASTAQYRINIIQLWPVFGGGHGQENGYVDFSVHAAPTENGSRSSDGDDINEELVQLKKIIRIEQGLVTTIDGYVDELLDDIDNAKSDSLSAREQSERLQHILAETKRSLEITKHDYADMLKEPEDDPDAPPLEYGKYLIFSAAFTNSKIRKEDRDPHKRGPIVSRSTDVSAAPENSEIWEIQLADNGWYTIAQRSPSFKGEGTALAIVANAANSEGDVESDVFFAEKNLQSPAFQWRLEKKVDGTYVIRNLLDGRVLQNTGSRNRDFLGLIKVASYDKSNNKYQRWLFEKIA